MYPEGYHTSCVLCDTFLEYTPYPPPQKKRGKTKSLFCSSIGLRKTCRTPILWLLINEAKRIIYYLVFGMLVHGWWYPSPLLRIKPCSHCISYPRGIQPRETCFYPMVTPAYFHIVSLFHRVLVARFKNTPGFYRLPPYSRVGVAIPRCMPVVWKGWPLLPGGNPGE